VKLETYLRMADIPYTIAVGDPREAPKGKVPWIEIDDQKIGDSALIIERLKTAHGDPLDARLTPREQALGHAIQKLLEESLYFVSSWSKWAEDENFAIYSAELFSGMPAEQLEYVPDMVRKLVISKFEAQGIGRHSRDEIHAMGVQDVTAFSELLGEGPWLFGAQPTTFDASAFGVIGNLKDGPFPSPVRDHIRNTPNIVGYIDRIRHRYFSDLE
jgi:glutathione S-transferase